MINKDWVIGFTDGEGWFSTNFMINNLRKFLKYGKRRDMTLYSIFYPIFGIELHEEDLPILEKIKTFFGVGTLRFRSKNSLKYKRRGLNASNSYEYKISGRNCKIVKKFFSENNLLGAKKKHFEIWCKIIDFMEEKNRFFTKEDILNIAKLRDSMIPHKEIIKRDYNYVKNLIEENEVKLNPKQTLLF